MSGTQLVWRRAERALEPRSFASLLFLLSVAWRHGALSARFFFLEHTGGTAELQLEDKALLQLSPLVAALLVGLPSC